MRAPVFSDSCIALVNLPIYPHNAAETARLLQDIQDLQHVRDIQAGEIAKLRVFISRHPELAANAPPPEPLPPPRPKVCECISLSHFT